MFAHEVIQGLQADVLGLQTTESMKGIVAWVRDLLPKSQQFFVGDYDRIFHSVKPSHKLIFLDDCEDLRLPYPVCWFCYTAKPTPQQQYEVNGYKFTSGSTKGGVLVFEYKADLLFLAFACYFPSFKAWTLAPFAGGISIGRPFRARKDQEDEIVRNIVARTGGDYNLFLSEAIPSHPESKDASDRIMEAVNSDLIFTEIVLRLLNCRNIGTLRHDPPPKLNAKRRRTGKTEIFSYHTLVIKPTGPRQESIPKHLWENRIHLQRGHFKTYTAERPLFGSITGRFWWQPHVRGRNRDGVVMKDYEIDTGVEGVKNDARQSG